MTHRQYPHRPCLASPSAAPLLFEDNGALHPRRRPLQGQEDAGCAAMRVSWSPRCVPMARYRCHPSSWQASHTSLHGAWTKAPTSHHSSIYRMHCPLLYWRDDRRPLLDVATVWARPAHVRHQAPLNSRQATVSSAASALATWRQDARSPIAKETAGNLYAST